MGVDIAMAFDECPAYGLSHAEVEKSMELTHRWARRSLDGATRHGSAPALFGIVQGGIHHDLRKRSVEEIAAMDFDGVAIGGVSVGEPKEEMLDVVRLHGAAAAGGQAALPDGRRHAGGSGERRGGRHRHVRLRDADAERAQRLALHELGKVAIKNAKYAADERPLDPDCSCLTCRDGLARLSAAPLRQRRDRRLGVQHDPQRLVLP